MARRIHPKKILLFFIIALIFSCSPNQKTSRVRVPVDTVGFAHTATQMDSVMTRIHRLYAGQLDSLNANLYRSGKPWKAVICPHDDYSYVGWLYPGVLKGIEAHTILLFGVAHKARRFNLENKIIFGRYEAWKEPRGPVAVSSIRDELIRSLPEDLVVVHDSMQAIEHSVEAIIPFLQYQNPKIQIVPILVPYMSFARMQEISHALAVALQKISQKKHWKWGKDFAMVMSSDAVHYGNAGWGGQNYAPYGTDPNGTQQAIAHEMEIIHTCLEGEMGIEKLKKFNEFTVDSTDFHLYKWTWCGRYSVPFGLLTATTLARLQNATLVGSVVGYANSIDHPHLPVTDLKMGLTAPANNRHWVGYAALGYW